jgi:hypothetical protein
MHYGDYNVGIAVLVRLAPKGNERVGRLRIFLGYNHKLFPEAYKFCAEMHALWRMMNHRVQYKHVIGFALCAPPRRDDGTGVETPVRYSCEVCRMVLPIIPGVGGNTMICSINSKTWRRGPAMTIRRMNQKYFLEHEVCQHA